MWRASPLELFLGLLAGSGHWQSMCNAVTSAEARNAIKGFGESGDVWIAGGWAVAFARLEAENMRLTGEPSSFTASGEILLAIEVPQGGPAGTYGAVLNASRDLEDGHMAAWDDVRTVRGEVLGAGGKPGVFCPRSFDVSEVTRGHWVRANDRWRFHCRVTWGAGE